ncbi:MAG: copper ion binding protein [Oscillospiraceae bacterium]|jgi:copper chaperone|nr:copper ion binding protein [Oscillospiraceae bacterium]
MSTTVLKVDGMECQHCVGAVTKAVSALSGVTEVAVDLEGGTATVKHGEGVTFDALKLAIEDQGYDVIV